MPARIVQKRFGNYSKLTTGFVQINIYRRDAVTLESATTSNDIGRKENGMECLITCETGGSNTLPQLIPDQTIESSGQSDSVSDPKVKALESGRGSFHSGAGSEQKLFPDVAGRHAAASLALNLGSTWIANEYSGDLVDVTRSLRNRNLFSKRSRAWSRKTREQLVDLIHRPYQAKIKAAIEELLSQHGIAIHLSFRSFNLKSRGKIRRTDVGLLYDPSRQDEVDLCLDWIDEMWDRLPMLRVRRNYPRRGTSVGITRWLRTEFVGQRYVGVEVWLNRAWVARSLAVRDEVIAGMGQSLQTVLGGDEHAGRIAA